MDFIINRNLIIEKKYIAFDFFDTLVYREVSPRYVKKLWAKEVIHTLSISLTMQELYNQRLKIEAQLKLDTQQKNGNRDFCIFYLYSHLYDYINEIKSKITRANFIQQLLKIELSTELRLQKPICEMAELLYDMHKYDKKLILVSDYYLPSQYVKKMLIYHELDYFNHLFISCDTLQTKETGDLYKKVLKDLSISPNEMIMIGDNYVSDYKVPKNLNLNSIWVNGLAQYKK